MADIVIASGRVSTSRSFTDKKTGNEKTILEVSTSDNKYTFFLDAMKAKDIKFDDLVDITITTKAESKK